VGHVAYIGKKKNAYRPFVRQTARKRQLERPTLGVQERLLVIGILKKQSDMV